MVKDPAADFFSRLSKHYPAFSAIGTAAAQFFDRLPALALALLCLRAAELAAGVQTGTSLPGIAGAAASAAGMDIISLARYLPVLFIFSLPFLLIKARGAGFWSLGLAWSALVAAYASLIQFFLTARVPLGADLFAYSVHDIRKTVAGGNGMAPAVIAGLLLALAGLWLILFFQSRRTRTLLSPRTSAVALLLSLLVLAAAPGRPGYANYSTEDAYNLALNKAAYFLDESLTYLVPARGTPGPGPAPGPASTASSSTTVSGFSYLDPKFPFLREERTPDALGPYFHTVPGNPPNLVFIIVEGLGRSFSGPGAILGSFTPKLDHLAANSLYWENFLAVQGRTFAVLPSIFGSLPFGKNGFTDLAGRMPTHTSLLSVLKGQGYRLKFYCGFDLDFENMRIFLRHQGMDVLVGETDFGAEYESSNDWGYADRELFSRTLAGEAADNKQPFVSVIKTTTMHMPFTFRGQQSYYARLEKYLDLLGIPAWKKPAYREYRDIYTSILYMDEELGRFFEETKKNPAYKNTIFLVVGDHRLPEIPMAAKIDRYHVPLFIFSPLLKGPARIKSVSSHFDIAPSLLAFLSRNYGVQTPKAVTWLGSGLDMEPSFRNLHEIPIKQTKTNLIDFVSGTWYLNQNTLYKLNDGMAAEPSGDAAAREQVKAQFAAFKSANDQFARSLALIPETVAAELGKYRSKDITKQSLAAAAESAAEFAVRAVTAPKEAPAGKLTIEAVFTNTGKTATGRFVPLIVLLTPDGRAVSESYGPAQWLAAGKDVSLQLPVKSQGVPPGRYFMAVIPSHPQTGKRMGAGKFRIPVLLR